jgi:hypothetical protein
VTKCGDNWPNIKIILSLATPRLDNLNVKVELTNALVKNKFHKVGNVFVCKGCPFYPCSYNFRIGFRIGAGIPRS